jgi:hypothetical protein
LTKTPLLQRCLVAKFTPPDKNATATMSPAYTGFQYLTKLRANFATTHPQNKYVFDTTTNTLFEDMI